MEIPLAIKDIMMFLTASFDRPEECEYFSTIKLKGLIMIKN